MNDFTNIKILYINNNRIPIKRDLHHAFLYGV
nr:MAG TPA: hypothetical protein [Caudoviricetes sp.]